MAVVAKFFCSNVEQDPYTSTAAQVHLGAVCRGRENRQWASATPYGTITMGIRNDAATAYFEQGEEYLVTFTKVAKPAVGDGHAPIPAPNFGGTEDSLCETCGVSATKRPDGTLDWWAHDQMYNEGRIPSWEEIQARGAATG
jgi:hypothetical protein